MIKKRLIILFVFSFYLGANLIAQEIKWAVHANVGVGQITLIDLDSRSNLFEEKSVKNYFKPTWNYGTSCAIRIDEDIDIEIGLNILKINGKLIYNLEHPNRPNRFYIVRNKAETYYLGLPVNLNFNLNNFIFTTGFKTLIYVKGEYTNYVKGNPNLSGSPTYLNRQGSFNFRRFDLGINMGLKYKINESFTINTDCYWGMINMFANPSPSGNGLSRRNRFLTMGMSYYIDGLDD